MTSFLDQYKFWALETIPEKITLKKLFALEWLKFLWWDFLAPKSEKFKHRKWAVSEKLQIAPKLEYRRFSNYDNWKFHLILHNICKIQPNPLKAKARQGRT